MFKTEAVSSHRPSWENNHQAGVRGPNQCYRIDLYYFYEGKRERFWPQPEERRRSYIKGTTSAPESRAKLALA